jgi:DNA-binding MarR family transcriptional regulator
MFVGPDAGPFEMALKSCSDLRDEMHRVTHQMALTIDNSAAALRRSADSKTQDRASKVVVLTEIGHRLREHIEEIFNLISVGRAEADLKDRWQAQGLEDFDAIDVGGLVDQAATVNTSVTIRSATFQRIYQSKLARALLGDDATPDVVEAIEREIEENVTEEEFAYTSPEEMAAKAAAATGTPPGKPRPQQGAQPQPGKEPAQEK